MIKTSTIRLIVRQVGFCLVGGIVLLWADVALAQRRPIADDTLGAERTIVRPVANIRGRPGDRIEGGARRGNNLFHSFRDFQVDAGRAVYFADPGVDNILGRVTGNLPSEILGTLGVVGGDANLFLINPNGIIFGENARLDVGGSFAATTANGIGFGNQGFFNVADPNAPPLLTVQPSVFLFNQINPGAIENQSRTFLANDRLGNRVLGLRVPNGRDLVLLGGNVINQGNLNAFGGRIELAAIAGVGTVGRNVDGSLSVPTGIARADVRITDGSQIVVASNSEGDIVINGRNIDISGGSLLQAGIFSGLGTVDSQAGNVVLNGTGEIQVRQSSLITNNVGANGIGSSGNVYITAGSLFITEGASLQAITFGQGDAGSVIIHADDRVVFDNGTAFSTVGAVNFDGEVVGDGGNVEIYTDALGVLNGAALAASTFGQGNAGDVIIHAGDRVVFDNGNAFSTAGAVNFDGEVVGDGGNVEIYTDALGVLNGAALAASTFGQGNAGEVIIDASDRVVFDNGTAFSSVEQGGIGNGGDINITTNTLTLRNGAALTASTNNRGNAGNIRIAAADVVLDGIGSDGRSEGRSSGLFSYTYEGATGRGGNIRVDAGNLRLTDGAVINAQTYNSSDGGDITLNTDTFEATGGGQVITTTLGSGQAGNITLNATNRARLSGFDPTYTERLRQYGTRVSNQNAPSGLFANAARNSSGQGGTIQITAGQLDVTDGGRLNTSTVGQGNAGDVMIDARRVLFDGTSTNRQFSSGAFSSAEQDSKGNGGNITIDTNILTVRNGAQLQALTRGRGNAGDVMIDAGDRVVFDAGNAFSSVEQGGTGNGGNINITANSLAVRNGAQLVAATRGEGNAGSVVIHADDQVVFDNGSAISTVGAVNFSGRAVGQGGSVRITTASLNVLNGASLQASTFGQGNAGSVIIRASDRVVFDGGNAFSSVEQGGVGIGGNINIDTNALVVRNGAQLTASTTGRGSAGNIRIDAGDVLLNGVGNTGLSSGLFTSSFTGASGRGGDIRVDAGSVRLTDGAVINAQTYNAFRGGNITLNANTFEATGGGQVITTTLGGGQAGNITLNATNRVTVSGFDPTYTERRRQFGTRVSNQNAPSGLFANTARNSSGRGGTIEITAGQVNVTDGGELTTSTAGQGDAGDVMIDARSVLFDGTSTNRQFTSAAFSSVEQGGVGIGGNINIDTNALVVRNGAQLSAVTRGQGDAGNIQITADTVSLNGVSHAGFSSGLFTSTASTAIGRGGDITVRADSIHLTDGAVVNAETSNAFRGGNITLNADTFTGTGGGQVVTTARGGGNAGNITLNADRITLSGLDFTYAARRRQYGSRVSNQGPASGLFANTRPGSSGQGGTIQITAGELDIFDRARIVVNSQGSDVAGNMDITAQSVQLNRGRLTAETETSDGGNITLDNIDFLQLQNGSRISTTAGTNRAGGNGGNITIDSNFIVASPNENSDITANAFTGSGGNVTITTQGLFGIEPQVSPTDRSDITASSELGVQGTININTPDVDPSRGLIELPTVPVDASDQIAQTCSTGGSITRALGEFVVTGRGGLPANPTEILGGEVALPRLSGLADESTEEQEGKGANREANQSYTANTPPPTIVEAQGWQSDANGNIVLIAAATPAEPHLPAGVVQCGDSD